ncbi:MAG TPA: winged helix-turn-helix domain-containing protein, partial [Blastocatellia bacterium]|nr:winged helix-turn-helix domain-containing protein [Blastocatellia bacterium]
MTAPINGFYEFGPFSLDAEKRVLLRDGEVVALMPKAFDTLLALVEHHGEVLEKNVLMDMLWPESEVEEGNLAYNISAIRKALGESPNERKYIITVPSKGYKFAADVKGPFDNTSDLLLARYTKSTVLISDQGKGHEVTEKPEGLPPRSLTPARWWKLVYAGVAVAILVFGVAALYSLLVAPRSTLPTPPVRSIAVLPFKPLVADQRDESLEMGMADSLIAKLSNINGVVVRPLASVRRYGGLEQDALAAGGQLGVDAALDGTIQLAGDSVRVAARLISIGDGRQLWDGHFDARFTDIFSVQDLISEKA